MRYLPLILFAIAALITILWNREHMTNEDVMTAMKQFGVEDTPKNKGTIPKAPILGPEADKPVEPEPEENGKTSKSGTYPEIYAPDIPLLPGQRSKEIDDNKMDYNIDLAKLFPTAGGPPQPYLNDFSPFQR